ncbi:MAG TPA: cytochrome c biogenesis protein DipZ [Solimonas sp.]
MTLLLLAYLGGALTILSPCILPVLPFVFARADRDFLRNGAPLLLGMAITFAAVASLAAVGGHWAVEANRYGRLAALLLMTLFGLGLLWPALAERALRPLVAIGARVSQRSGEGPRGAFMIGAATGLLWAPCAGPILGLVLTGAALQGPTATGSALLLAYAAGAATSLALALVAGGRLLAGLKRALGVGEWLRRGLGAGVLVSVAAIALGLDTGLLTRLSVAGTTRVEQALIERIHPQAAERDSGATTMMMAANPSMMMAAPGAAADGATPPEMPSLDGAVEWLNSPPLSTADLRGKVVLVDFWTYSCINCLRTLPTVRAWAERYRDQGLVVIGVHAPEFAFEKDLGNVRDAVRDLGITYPVAVDNDYRIWRAFRNRYWPAHYFVDAQGRIRHRQFGEGNHEASETVIRQLLSENGRPVSGEFAQAQGQGAALASDAAQVGSPETYLGYDRAENFASPGGAQADVVHGYALPRQLDLNQWGLQGRWQVEDERAVLVEAPGRIAYRFHARDLHLVLGPAEPGRRLRFRVTIDGHAPGVDHGVDVDAAGNGVVEGQRLYQLIRQQGGARERRFEIEFLDAGLQAYAFTFG